APEFYHNIVRFISLHIVLHCCKTVKTGINFHPVIISFLQAVLSFVYLGIGTAVVSFLRKSMSRLCQLLHMSSHHLHPCWST
uniref:Uncharacterized protein n=1 Tax=Aegilops tauschii subsp. strangulata TaxID=200361 RepID=A0A453FAB6_AEGTS